MERKSWVMCLQCSALLGATALAMIFLLKMVPTPTSLQQAGWIGYAIGALLFTIASITTGAIGMAGLLTTTVRTICHRHPA
ncbi:MAG: hypothetical protein G01um101420_378 [Parcubacteria group bacterium Gr01-1014_20]|nr:MAG: hypothetical protein G01um101420_378 [Parcubacteria group bacterium Gr01-1014_20]